MLERKLTLKEQQLKLREDAILDVVNRLLGERGYESMTVDDVAAEVGIAKASLYKHFDSKEALAGAAMIRLLDRLTAHVAALPVDMSAYEKLRETLRWTLQIRMNGGLPLLPSNSPTLRNGLLANTAYLSRVLTLNEALLDLVERAKQDGKLAHGIPSDVALFAIYARSCDPSIEYLRLTGQYSDNDIVQYLLATCFGGLLEPAARS